MLSSLNWDYLRKEGDGLRLRCESAPLWPAPPTNPPFTDSWGVF